MRYSITSNFNTDFMINREVNCKFNIFSAIRNDFGHVFICWWVTGERKLMKPSCRNGF